MSDCGGDPNCPICKKQREENEKLKKFRGEIKKKNLGGLSRMVRRGR